MSIKKRFNEFLDKYDIVDRYDDESIICHYEKLQPVALSENQRKIVNKLLKKRSIPPLIASVLYLIFIMIMIIFVDNKDLLQILLILFFLTTGIIFFRKNLKKLNEKCDTNTKAYLATVIEKKLVHSNRGSAFVIIVLFDFNQKDYVSLKYNKFARKINVGDKVIVVKTNKLLSIPYDCL